MAFQVLPFQAAAYALPLSTTMVPPVVPTARQFLAEAHEMPTRAR
jgi:hypothetical protein